MWIPKTLAADKPKYLALVDAIAQAIECGELTIGDRLPPQRQLAWKLGINPSTTMQAYREATRRHLISGEVGRGTFVLAGSKEASLFALYQDQALSLIDLSKNVPAIDERNRDIETTLLMLIEQGKLSGCQHHLSSQLLEFAQTLFASWQMQRGMSLQPNEVKVCAGAQQGIFATLQAFCQSGETIFVEAYTAPGIKAAARALGLPLCGVPMDEEGIMPDELRRLIRATGARIIVLTPILQNPTAATMTEERKQEIAEIIKQHQLILIEDDVYGALTEMAPLSEKVPEQSVLISSFSKTVVAGLRIGFIMAKLPLLALIDPDYHETSWTVSPLNLLVMCEWLRSDIALRRLEWQKKEVKQRWYLAQKILLPYIKIPHEPSPHLWLQVTQNRREFVSCCRAKGIAVVPADAFSVTKKTTNAVRVSLVGAKSHVELKIALEKILQLLMLR